METGETPNSLVSNKKISDKITQFPIYSSFDRGLQKEGFLTEEELIVQTNRFLQRFAETGNNQKIPDTIFFLDKSARPLAYMFRKLFPLYCPDSEIPEIRFINIGGSGSKLYDAKARPFTGNPEAIKRIYGSHINQEGNIVIIDEYSHTGKALREATEVFSQAFPNIKLQTMVAYDKLPNWYQNEAYLGVEEYDEYDYKRMALKKLNEEFETNYGDVHKFELRNNTLWGSEPEPGVDYESVPEKERQRYKAILQEITGTISYVKRGEHIHKRYERRKPNTLQKLVGKKTEVIERKKNVFREARVELDKICEKILSKRQKVK